MTIPQPKEDGTATEQRLRKFLAQHKISIREYSLTPKIGDILFRGIGGRNRAIETLKFSSNPQARQLLEFCEKLKWSTREQLPIEALCLAAKVDVATIAGAIVMAARDVAKMESALITMREHPNTVEATARWGQMFADNSKDREMMHKAVGWLPTPKGSSVNVNVFDPKGASVDDDDEDGIPSLEAVFDSDPREIENWGNARAKLLEASCTPKK